MIEIYPAIKNHFKPAIPIYRSTDGKLELDRHRFGDVVDIGPVTMENPDSEFLDLSEKWGGNICHWLVDVIPPALFGLRWQADLCRKTVLLNQDAINFPHVRSYLKMLGFSKWEAKGAQGNPTVIVNPLCHLCLVHPNTVRDLRRRFIDVAVSLYPMSPNTNLLIQRACQGCGSLESRNFENREEIINRFHAKKLPLTMVYLEGLPVWQQIAMFAQAKTIIGAHGAGLIGILFCRQDCKFIEVASPHFWNSPYAEIASQLRLKFSVLIGNMVNQDSNHPFYRYGLNVSYEHLLELLN